MINEPSVYMILCVADSKRYIGSSLRPYARWASHRSTLHAGTHKNPHLQAAWARHGEAAFRFSILERCDAQFLRAREASWIAELTPEFNVIKSIQDHWEYSAEARRKISLRMIGNKNGLGGKSRLGQHLSDEQKRKMSLALRGKSTGPKSEETRRKISIAKQGMAISESTKSAISLALRGKPKSTEHRAKLSISNKGHRPSEACVVANRRPKSAHHRAELAIAQKRRKARERLLGIDTRDRFGRFARVPKEEA